MKMPQTTIEKLKKTILASTIMSIFLVGVIVALAAIYPLTRHLREDAERHLLDMVKSKKLDIEQFLTRLEQTTWQITSRTRAREKLEQYNRKKVSLQQFINFSKPVLRDALDFSQEAVGCLRFDEKGKPVVQAGLSMPEPFRMLHEETGTGVKIDGPVLISGNLYLFVKAPIFNRNRVRVGTDLLAFQLEELRTILQDRTGLGKTGAAFLGRVDKNRVTLLFPPEKTGEKNINIKSPLAIVMKQALHCGHNEYRLFKPRDRHPYIFAYSSIPRVRNLVIVTRIHTGEFYAPINRQIVTTSLVISFLLLAGTLGTLFLMRPLAGKIIIRTEELNSINRQIEQSRNMLQLIIESIPVRVFWKDRNFRFLGCNTHFARDAGFHSPEELLGKDDFAMCWKEQADLYRADDRQVIESLSPKMNIIEPQSRSTGGTVWLNTSKVPLQMPGGEVIGILGIYEDITERKKAEEMLKESEEKYMDLYENAPDMYLSVNATTAMIEKCNNTFAGTIGYSKEEIIGRPVFDIYHPECMDKVKEVFTSFLQTGVVHNQELQLRKKDGSRLDVSLNATSVRDEEGHILYSRSILRDISDRKNSEAFNASRIHLIQFAASHSLDDFLEETINEAEKLTQSKIGFYVFVEESQATLTLQNWSTRTKAEFCKAEGKGIHYNISEAGVWADSIIQNKPVIHNNYSSLPHRRGLPEGHAELIRELVVPVRRGDKIMAVIAVGTKPNDYDETDIETVSAIADLTWEIAERKRTEDRILRSDQRLRLHSEQSPLGFLEWDENFRAAEWNAACEKIFGYTRKEAIGRHAKELILPAEVHELVDGIYHELMNRTGGQHNINENITKDGRIITCEWFNTTLIDNNGKAIGVASVCRDITEEKRMEAELASYREHLEEQVRERTVQLETANRELEAFAYSVSHDLRAPLRHIDGFIELLRQGAGTGLDEKHTHYLENISGAAQKMGTLIDDLLSFSRIGRVEIRLKDVDLKIISDEVIRELEPDTAERDIQWNIDGLPVVSGDPSLLRVVIMNLFSNAVKFTRSQDRAVIEAGCTSREEETVVFVRDNGVGFDQAYADKIFDVFQRLHRVDEFEGTGVGLAIVQRIIHRHGGRVWARGEQGRGATFYFSLPSGNKGEK